MWLKPFAWGDWDNEPAILSEPERRPQPLSGEQSLDGCARSSPSISHESESGTTGRRHDAPASRLPSPESFLPTPREHS